MAWQEITTAEIAPRQPLDSELFNKIRNNLYIGLGSLGLPKIIPNGSFEFSTGTVPMLWTASTYATAAGGSASISTVSAHGANSLKVSRGAANAKVSVYSDDYIAVASTYILLHGIIWTTGASGLNTAVKGGIAVRTYDATYGAISTYHYNHSSWTNTPTTYSIPCIMATNTRFIKVGCACDSDCTVVGGMFFDALYIVNT